jgi:hypothetical protein
MRQQLAERPHSRTAARRTSRCPDPTALAPHTLDIPAPLGLLADDEDADEGLIWLALHGYLAVGHLPAAEQAVIGRHRRDAVRRERLQWAARAGYTGPLCGDCGAPPGPNGLVRGRCGICYHERYRAGTHIDLPRQGHSRADLIDDYLALRGRYSRRQIAARLGIQDQSLWRALHRARQAGDPRLDGVDFYLLPTETRAAVAA